MRLVFGRFFQSPNNNNPRKKHTSVQSEMLTPASEQQGEAYGPALRQSIRTEYAHRLPFDTKTYTYAFQGLVHVLFRYTYSSFFSVNIASPNRVFSRKKKAYTHHARIPRRARRLAYINYTYIYLLHQSCLSKKQQQTWTLDTGPGLFV